MTGTEAAATMLRGCLALALALSGLDVARAATLTLSIPKLEATAGQEVEVPITVKGAKGMSALQVLLTYDPAVLEVVKDAAEPDKTFAKGKILPDDSSTKVFTDTPGRLPILFVGGADPKKGKEYHAIEEDGTLLTIRFRVAGQAGQKTALMLEKAEAFQSNDMDMLVKTEAGELAIGSGLPWVWIVIAAGALLLLLLPVLLLTIFRRRKPEPVLAGTAAAPLHGQTYACLNPVCRQPVPQGSAFCPHCGQKMA